MAGVATPLSNEPPYVTVRWIRSLGTTAGIPDGAWVWWDAAVLEASWSSPAAARGVYLRGTASGDNGGLTGGSASSHSHSWPAHSHPIAAHSHSGGTSSSSSSSESLATPSSGVQVPAVGAGHTHTVTVTSAANGASGAQTSGSTGSTTATVPNIVLGVMQNDTGGFALPVGIIGLWLGLLSSIPLSLHLCDGTGGTQDTRGRYVKGATLSGSDFTGIGTTGGAETHDHTDPSTHTHTTAHTHNSSLDATTGTTSAVPSGSATATSRPHTHTGPTTGSGGGTSGSAAETVADGDHNPPHRRVCFVKYTGAIDVTITDPTADEVLTTSTLDVAWTLSAGTQTTRRVRVYASDLETLLFDSGIAATGTQSYQYVGTGVIRNGEDYYVLVSVVNNSSLPGEQIQHFSAAWTPPDTIANLTATAIETPGALPGITLAWDVYGGQGTLLRYRVYRRKDGEDDMDWVAIASVDPGTEEYVDYSTASRQLYEYAVTAEVNMFGDVLEGEKQ